MPPDPLLEIENLSVGYTDEPVVVDFSAAIAEGTVTTVIGPNGAGKSTLLRALYGLNRYFGGRVRFLGQAIEALPPRERRKLGIGFVPQGRCNFPLMTVRENLELGAYTLRGAAAVAAAVERTLAQFPLLASKLSVLAGNLSGGEQQILETAMVLEAGPSSSSSTSPRSASPPPIRIRSSPPSPDCAAAVSPCWWSSRMPTAPCRYPTRASSWSWGASS